MRMKFPFALPACSGPAANRARRVQPALPPQSLKGASVLPEGVFLPLGKKLL